MDLACSSLEQGALLVSLPDPAHHLLSAQDHMLEFEDLNIPPDCDVCQKYIVCPANVAQTLIGDRKHHMPHV